MSRLTAVLATLMLATLVRADRVEQLGDLGFVNYPEVGFYTVGFSMNWADANHDCIARGAKLAVINSEEERAALVDLMSKYGSATPYYFAGFTNAQDYKTFVTNEGLPIEKTGYTEWEVGHPLDQQQRCGVIVEKTGELSDDDCLNTQSYICEIELWNDYQYYTGYGYYKIYTEGQRWINAYKTCVRDGAHLMVIDSYGEANVARSLYNEYPSFPMADSSDYIYTGFRNVPDAVETNSRNKKYLTIFGTSVSNLGYVQWAYNEPNTENSAICGTLERGNVYYKMYACDKSLAFICEKEPEDFTNGDGTTWYPDETTTWRYHDQTTWGRYETTR